MRHVVVEQDEFVVRQRQSLPEVEPPGLRERHRDQRRIGRADRDDEDDDDDTQHHPAQGAELHQLRPRTLAGERHVGAPRQECALQVKGDHGDEHEHERQRGRQSVFRRIIEQRVDAGRQREDAGGQPDDRLRAEQGERIHEREQRAGEDRGRNQRSGDRERGAQLAGAENLRRLLVGGIDREERARGQKIDERERVHDRHEHQPRHGEDVEGEPGQAGGVAHQHVDQPGIGAEQIGQRDGGEKRRRQIGERGGQLNERLARHVGAAHRPCQHQAENQAEQARPGAEDQRILERGEIEASGQDLAEMIEAEPILALDAAEQQRQQRQHHEHDERDDGAPHHHMLELEPGAQRWPREAGMQRGTDNVSRHSDRSRPARPRTLPRRLFC